MESLLVSLKAGVRLIRFNKPSRKNALDATMYEEITKILKADTKNDNVVVTVLTGCGEYFSSGYDLIAASDTSSSSDEQKLQTGKLMVDEFISYSKPIIAVVNGPAIGIGTTITALCDIAYASDKAYFRTPFVNLGLSLEACSSFLFPSILGKSKASEVLLLNHKLSAQEAYQFGLVSKVIPENQLDEFIEDLHKFGQLPLKSLIINKRLIKENYKNAVLECSQREYNQLKKCINSDEFKNNITKFISKERKS